MKVVFISNFFNHHQKPVCDAFYKKIGDDFTFVETTYMNQARKNMGWNDIEYPCYVLRYTGNYEEKIYENLIEKSDVIIYGSVPQTLLKMIKESNSLIFRYSERPIKNTKKYWLKYPFRLVKWHFQNNKNTNLLCASAFSSYDFCKFGLYKKRSYKWGYFPKTSNYDNPNLIIESKKKSSILWVGRMIDLKNPEHAIEVAHRLKLEGIQFTMRMIGNGHKVQSIKQLIKDYCLEDSVELIGAVNQSEVRKYMEEAELFLFTSNHEEGWGAVLNESMNSMCAVVSNARIGSAPFLIEHGKNGLLYDEDDIDQLYENVKYLLLNDFERESIAKEAYDTIVNAWNADSAVSNLFKLIDAMQNKDLDKINELVGPCSKATVLKDDWFRRFKNGKL